MRFPLNTSYRKVLRAAPLALALSVMLAGAARAQDAIVKEWRQAFDRSEAVVKQDPKAALAELQKFVQAHPGATGEVLHHVALAYQHMYFIQRHIIHSPEAAMETLDEGLRAMGKSFERQILIGHKADLLLGQGKTTEAEALLVPEWPLAEQEDIRRIALMAGAYVTLLQKQNKSAQAAAEIRGLQERHLANLAWEPFQWLPKQLIPAQLKAGAVDEAVSWAKLIWMACPFREAELNEASQLLVQAWAAQDLTPAKGTAFIKAQEDAAAPNPLKEVPLPKFRPEDLQAQLAAEPAHLVHERVTLMMLAGDWHGAMLEARAQMIANLDDPRGALEVCRVFKAADLNLVRANAFLKYLKDGEGENPIAAFLKQHPRQDAAARK